MGSVGSAHPLSAQAHAPVRPSGDAKEQGPAKSEARPRTGQGQCPPEISTTAAARGTLPEFLALARAPRPTATKLAVKIAIPDGDGNEYFWLTQFEPRRDKYAGRINNTPRSAKQVKFGQVVEFSEAEIVDWLYME